MSYRTYNPQSSRKIKKLSYKSTYRHSKRRDNTIRNYLPSIMMYLPSTRRYSLRKNIYIIPVSRLRTIKRPRPSSRNLNAL